jgi:hypothetical protein
MDGNCRSCTHYCLCPRVPRMNCDSGDCDGAPAKLAEAPASASA